MKYDMHKAQATDSEVKSLIVIMTAPFPSKQTLKAQTALMSREAEDLARQLKATLPQGTWDRFVGEVVRLHATLLINNSESKG